MSYCKLVTYVLLALFSSNLLTMTANAAVTDNTTGLSFPDTEIIRINDADHTLQSTGVATRKKFFAKIYTVAHYMEDPQGKGDTLLNEILNSNRPKQLSIKWVRSISGKKVQEGYKESFNKAIERDQRRALQTNINQFIGFFSYGVREGDTHHLIWLPDGTIQVIVNGDQVGTIQDKEFAKALWSIWFGRKSVVNRMDLISRFR